MKTKTIKITIPEESANELEWLCELHSKHPMIYLKDLIHSEFCRNWERIEIIKKIQNENDNSI